MERGLSKTSPHLVRRRNSRLHYLRLLRPENFLPRRLVRQKIVLETLQGISPIYATMGSDLFKEPKLHLREPESKSLYKKYLQENAILNQIKGKFSPKWIENQTPMPVSRYGSNFYGLSSMETNTCGAFSC